MSEKVQLLIRTANRDRQASITAPVDATVDEILRTAQDNWRLPSDYEYVIRCERLGAQLRPGQTLQQALVQDQDILEIQPLADAG